MIRDELADDRCVPASGMAVHRLRTASAVIGRQRGHQLSFVGDVKRIETQHFARALHFFANGNREFLE